MTFSDEWYKCEIWLDEESYDRLNSLMRRGVPTTSMSSVVKAALKIYEDGLNAVDESKSKPNSMSFEVFSEE